MNCIPWVVHPLSYLCVNIEHMRTWPCTGQQARPHGVLWWSGSQKSIFLLSSYTCTRIFGRLSLFLRFSRSYSPIVFFPRRAELFHDCQKRRNRFSVRELFSSASTGTTVRLTRRWRVRDVDNGLLKCTVLLNLISESFSTKRTNHRNRFISQLLQLRRPLLSGADLMTSLPMCLHYFVQLDLCRMSLSGASLFPRKFFASNANCLFETAVWKEREPGAKRRSLGKLSMISEGPVKHNSNIIASSAPGQK